MLTSTPDMAMLTSGFSGGLAVDQPPVPQAVPSTHELMDKSGSPLVALFTPLLHPCAPLTPGPTPPTPRPLIPAPPTPRPPTPAPPTVSLAPGPSASPAPLLMRPSAPSVVHYSAPVKVENISSHESLRFSERGSATPIALPSSLSPLSYCTESDRIPPPESVSPLIQGLNRYELFQVVHPETLRAWDAVPGSKVVIFIANDTITKETHHHITLIRKALRTIFPNANPVIGSAALASDHDVAHFWPVYPFLVHHLPQLYLCCLILEHCWTVNSFTFFALDFSLPMTSFVMTLAGLHLPAMPQSNHVVAQLVCHWLLNSAAVASFIRNHHDNLPSFMTVNEQIEFAISTVDVSNAKLGEEEDSPVAFNIYIHPPTNDPVQCYTWQHEIQGITYFTNCGTGKAAPLFHCDVCKGRDHSSVSCPFPSNTAFPQADAFPAEEAQESCTSI